MSPLMFHTCYIMRVISTTNENGFKTVLFT